MYMEYRKYTNRIVRHVVSVPFIWANVITIVAADIILETYHQICFPLYGLEKLDRSKYIAMDRQRLSYLSFIQKMNCMYCGYVNGWFAYASVIAAITEQYWCGIKHEKNNPALPHHASFVDYGDEAAFHKRYE